MNIKKSKHSYFLDPIISGTITVSIIIVCFIFFKFEPFGKHSLAIVDADIQYLDLFGFFKDVLEGKNDISFSFSNILGSNNVGTFSYYLSSPVNLLIVFFDKDNLSLFYNVISIIKIALSAVTFSIFLKSRFNDQISSVYVWILSISYALMTYNIIQSSNIMWLDGVYMLPLILLGIYKIISGKGMVLFSVTLALSFIFNWYTGGINCIFSIVWLVFELILFNNNHIKNIFSSLLSYFSGVLLSVAMSAALLLPTIYCLRLGKGAEFDWKQLSPVFNGNLLSAIPGFSISAESSKSAYSIYCGAIILSALIIFFSLERISLRIKITCGVFIFISVLILYWQPLFFAFSLFKNVSSYFSRYSYVSCFIIIFIAAHIFSQKHKVYTKKNSGIIAIIISTAIFSGLYLLLSYNKSIEKNVEIKYNILTIILVSLYVLLLLVSANFKKSKSFKYWINIIVLIIVISESFANLSALLKKQFSNTDSYAISEYIGKTSADIHELTTGNVLDYRINRTVVRNRNEKNFQSHYDESFMFNYYGIGSYTSSTDTRQTLLLDRLGYRLEGACMNIINDSVLTADSLLGAKYITTKEPFSKLSLIKKTDSDNIYKNEYAFPLAFKVKNVSDVNVQEKTVDTFDYQNRLFKILTGIDKDLYDRLEFRKSQSDNSLEYEISGINKDDIVYSYFFYSSAANATVFVDGELVTEYAKWMSPSVIRIPLNNMSEDHRSITKIKAEDINLITSAGFYKLNSDVLKEMSEVAETNKAKDITIRNSYFSCSIDSDGREQLFTSIPYEKGWTVKVNNSLIEPKLLYDCLMIIPLETGNNIITMEYKAPYVKEGMIISVVGIAVLALYIIIRKKIKDNETVY